MPFESPAFLQIPENQDISLTGRPPKFQGLDCAFKVFWGVFVEIILLGRGLSLRKPVLRCRRVDFWCIVILLGTLSDFYRAII